jgi:hypothetical protein
MPIFEARPRHPDGTIDHVTVELKPEGYWRANDCVIRNQAARKKICETTLRPYIVTRQPKASAISLPP